MSAATWQGRTARALVIGALGEGVFGLLAITVANGFAVATIIVAIVVGWYLGPVYGGIGAGFPPLGLAFVPSGDGHVGESISVAIFVMLLLGGSAWLTGRVRERYGRPPWAGSRGPAR